MRNERNVLCDDPIHQVQLPRRTAEPSCTSHIASSMTDCGMRYQSVIQHDLVDNEQNVPSIMLHRLHHHDGAEAWMQCIQETLIEKRSINLA
jgi:hypothetical protein